MSECSYNYSDDNESINEETNSYGSGTEEENTHDESRTGRLSGRGASATRRSRSPILWGRKRSGRAGSSESSVSRHSGYSGRIGSWGRSDSPVSRTRDGGRTTEYDDECSRRIGITVGRRTTKENFSGAGSSGEDCCSEEETAMEEDYFYDATRDVRHYKKIEDERSRIRKMFVQGFQNIPTRRRILHDVYEKKSGSNSPRFDSGHVRRDFERIHSQGTRKNGAVFIVCDHGDHYHVIHDCAYSSCTCRCRHLEQFRTYGDVGRRYSRQIVANIDYTIEHWINTAIYFEKEGRSLMYLDIAGRNWLSSSEAGHLQLLEDLQRGQEKLVEGSRSSQYFFDCQSRGSSAHSSPESIGQGSEAGNIDTGCEIRGKGDKIIEFLRKFPAAPINHIFSLSVWLQSKYKFFNRASPLMVNILKIVANFYNELSVVELKEHFDSCEPQNLIFNSPAGRVDEYYMSISESFDILEKLLFFQFDDDIEQVSSFVVNLFNVIDKKVPKKNTIFVLSEPNAGKNFFFDTFIHYCINFGQMGNFNRYCTFPLMECVDKRIILWNEPVMEPSATETLKCILGGDTCNAKVKFQGDAVITRTPVIVLSNNDVFPKDKAFRSRMYSYRWRSCDMLRNINKKPHPLCVYKFYSKYIEH